MFCSDDVDMTGSICTLQDDNNQAALEAIWDDLATKYDDLAEAEKSYLRTCARNFENSSLDARENSMGRYSFLVHKYQLDNFIGTDLSAYAFPSAFMANTGSGVMNPLWIVLLVSTGLGTALAFGFFHKKKGKKE